jgi:hypothetical protein
MILINEIKERIQAKIKKLDGSFRDDYMEIGGLETALDIIDEVYNEHYENKEETYEEWKLKNATKP